MIGRPEPIWSYLLHHLDVRLQLPVVRHIPCVHRQCDTTVFKSNGTMWSIDQGGRRLYAGLKINPSGIAMGPEEVVAGADLGTLERADVCEVLTAGEF